MEQIYSTKRFYFLSLNFQLSTFNSQLSTLNSQLSTLNSQLSALNFPKRQICQLLKTFWKME